tara:strand:- start:764 stop:2086 length:1323 start_codon:yes stop_codon:yes gene_type:complete
MSKEKDNNLLVQRRAKSIIPGISQLLSKRPDQFSHGVWPTYYKKAKGSIVWDLNNKQYIDMSIGGIGANILGYADDDVDNAVKEAISLGTSSSLNCYEDVDLAELLIKYHPWSEMTKFARSGGEAMAIAVRIARTYSEKEIVAFCGYHGWHDWYLAANLQSEENLTSHLLSGLSHKGIPSGLAGTSIPFRYNRIEELEEILSRNPNNIAAIVLEPIRNIEPEDSFLEKVKELAKQTSAVLIFDEISSGFRLNTGGAHMQYNVQPDIAVFSKALGNGYPIAAVIGVSDVMNASQSTFISSTNWSERIGPVAALATLKKHSKKKVADHLISIGTEVQNGWRKIAEKNDLSIGITGIKPLSHFAFNNENPELYKSIFVELMLDEGFLATTDFYSMYSHTPEQVEKYLISMDKVFQKIKEYEKQGNLGSKLRGKPATKGFTRLT